MTHEVPPTASRLHAIVSGDRCQHVVLAAIGVNAVVVGLETVPWLVAEHGGALRALDRGLLALFVVEIALRIAAEPLRFFRGGWNVFDATVVGVSLLPQVGSFATVARLARVLRVMRLVSTLPELRLIVATMLRSIPSMGHVILLLGLLLYVYGVVGYHLFHAVDPAHWGSLGAAVGTLFQILTLEGWVEIQARSATAHPFAWLFYGSFIVVAVFVVINLFIAVVINNLETARSEETARTDATHVERDLLADVVRIRAELDRLASRLRVRVDASTPPSIANRRPA